LLADINEAFISPAARLISLSPQMLNPIWTVAETRAMAICQISAV
jgi:hypothetical protein